MAYSDVVRHADMSLTDEIDLDAVAADKLVLGFKRPATILGWGAYVTEALGAPAADAVLALDHDPAGAGARVEKDTFSFLDSTALGVAVERSELVRGRSPVAPNAVLAAFDVAEGDLVYIEHKTAQTAAVAGKCMAYLLVAYKGAP